MKRHAPVFQARCHILGCDTKRRGEYLPFRCHGNGIQQRMNPIPENRVKTQLGYEAAAILWSHSRDWAGGQRYVSVPSKRIPTVWRVNTPVHYIKDPIVHKDNRQRMISISGCGFVLIESFLFQLLLCTINGCISDANIVHSTSSYIIVDVIILWYHIIFVSLPFLLTFP